MADRQADRPEADRQAALPVADRQAGGAEADRQAGGAVTDRQAGGPDYPEVPGAGGGLLRCDGDDGDSSQSVCSGSRWHFVDSP